MTDQEILTAVLTMNEDELDAKVAELKGLVEVRPGWWKRPDEKTCAWAWTPQDKPSRRIEDAWPLWEELEAAGKTYLFNVNGWHLVANDGQDFGPLGAFSIARAYVWWAWTQKEGC